ncbi:MAG: hypothetical protein PHT58_00155 [Eubacteriales bacterium]|nr:hypothetical protein [Eubacteriales bacterium]
MQAMMEQIALTEQEAENIRAKAIQDAKDSIARAKADAEAAIKVADDKEREKTKAALLQAEIDGAALGQSMMEEARVKIGSDRKFAEEKIPEAVKYLIERVESLA